MSQKEKIWYSKRKHGPRYILGSAFRNIEILPKGPYEFGLFFNQFFRLFCMLSSLLESLTNILSSSCVTSFLILFFRAVNEITFPENKYIFLMVYVIHWSWLFAFGFCFLIPITLSRLRWDHHLPLEFRVVDTLMYTQKVALFKAKVVKRKTSYFYYCFIYIINITILSILISKTLQALSSLTPLSYLNSDIVT